MLWKSDQNGVKSMNFYVISYNGYTSIRNVSYGSVQ